MAIQKKRNEPEKKETVVKGSTKQNNNNNKTTTTTATTKKVEQQKNTTNEKPKQQQQQLTKSNSKSPVVVVKKETKQQKVVEEPKPKSIIKQKPITTTTTTTKSLPPKQQQQQQQVVEESKKVEIVKKNKTKEIVNQTISVGCYENSILGFEATYVGDVAEPGFEVDLKMTYGYSSHTGCVKALSSTKNILVSSSTDETLKVYDLKKRVEFGQLTKHEGYVTCIQFFKNTHMFACSMDNTISVWRVSDWECLKVMSGPKGAINSISIHPSGKVALSVSKDRRLFLWDLTKGTSAHFIKLKTEGFNVQWSPSGNHYVVVFKDKIVIYNASNFEELISMEFKLQVLAVKFLSDDILMVGGEDKLLTLIEYKNNGKIIKELSGHDNRIKAIDTLSFKGVDKTYVVTASSDGLIIVWDPLESILPVGCVETGFRLTTLTVGPVSEKVKQIDEEEEDDDDDEANQNDDEDSEFDSEEEEAIANQPSKKMKVNIEMEQDDDEEEEDDEEEDDEEEDDDEDFDEDGDEIDGDDDEEEDN